MLNEIIKTQIITDLHEMKGTYITGNDFISKMIKSVIFQKTSIVDVMECIQRSSCQPGVIYALRYVSEEDMFCCRADGIAQENGTYVLNTASYEEAYDIYSDFRSMCAMFVGTTDEKTRELFFSRYSFSNLDEEPLSKLVDLIVNVPV